MAKRKGKGCDKWREGMCASSGAALYCPLERADNCPSGSCCHHPLFDVRPKLEEMNRAGIKLARYGERLKVPGFVDKLHSAFLAARKRRLSGDA